MRVVRRVPARSHPAGFDTRTVGSPVTRPPTRRAARGVALGLAALLLASCVTTRLPPASEAGPAFEPLPDEALLWVRARGEERHLRDVVVLYDDPALTDYLQEVVDRLTPRGMEDNPHLHYTVSVIDAQDLNAFAYPHGALYLHTGLLAQLENEDQLATLLGHEMSHVEYRHMLRYERAVRNREMGLTAASVALSVVLADAEADAWWDGDYTEALLTSVVGEMLLGLGLQLAFLASVNGYGRDLEWEADRGGIAKLDHAGYRLSEAPRFYETLRDSAASSGAAAANFFFGSHPRLARRVDIVRGLVADHGRAGNDAAIAGSGGVEDGGPDDLPDSAVTLAAHQEEGSASAEVRPAATSSAHPGDAQPAAAARSGEGRADDGEAVSPADRFFRQRLAPVIRDQAWWHLAEGRLEEAQREFERAVEWAPDDPLVHLLEGQLRLAQSVEAPSPEEEGWLRDDAGRAFLEAIRLDADLAEAHRDLGLMLYEDGDPGGACRELGFYLELAPEAEDAQQIDGYLEELEDLGLC